ncbi:TetR/AcrR family transcriptional regulator [candidate division WOR-3 bacterium]|nr:TetR/AcrR family transcriptional regulator [candidate division WOR-3 bacterium]
MTASHASKRSAIIAAAFSVVSEKGYHETRMDDVAGKAGVAKGTVYLYFKDKPDLYVGLVGWLLEQALAVVREVAARPRPARARLTAIFDELAGGTLARPAVMALLSPEHVEHSGDLLGRFRREVLPHAMEMVDAIAGIIGQGIRSGEFRRVEPRLAALAYLNGLRSALFAVANRLRLKDPVAAALELFYHGVGAVRRRTRRVSTKRS